MSDLYFDAGMFDKVNLAAAKGLYSAASLLLREHAERLSIDNPPPYRDSSHVGQYPRRRTGVGQLSCLMSPGTVRDIMDLGYVWLGYHFGGKFNYMSFLEEERHRLGWRKTLEDLQDQLGLEALRWFQVEASSS
jgi:hypothetical protein